MAARKARSKPSRSKARKATTAVRKAKATRKPYRLPKGVSTKTNTTKNSRAGRKYATRVVKGRVQHVYSIKGRKVVVNLRKNSKGNASVMHQKRAADGKWVK